MNEHLGSNGKAPGNMESVALSALFRVLPDAESAILSGYDGESATKKERLFREVLGLVYYEGYIAGASAGIPEDASEWNIEVIEDDKGEHDE